MKEFVCSGCYRSFVLPVDTSWLSGEKMPCPHCSSMDTTPMLITYIPGLGRIGKYHLIYTDPEDAREAAHAV
jgi:DNA-directed RNA polymerase subunit RPC12/RpoP